MGASASALFAYVYVPTEHLQSILKHGLLSARKLVELGIPIDTDKYAPQIHTALQLHKLASDPAYNAAADVQHQILAYLDWRVDPVQNRTGSCAIYFLWAPIPSNHRAFTAFLSDKTLVRFKLDQHEPLSTINGPMPSPRDWPSIFATLPIIRSLWFADVPHAMCFPRDGRIDPSRLYVQQ